ncbi:MAG: aminotransferase class V-fold PLP-dependent enzyme, partial [Microlunatus sp.]|nr:aminotransferase class V-fold PLP-dependent enzyme [Microlunatus sp.]
MDQNKTPVLDAIEEIRASGTYSFSLPGHRFGRGIDDRTAEVLSPGAFASDVPMAKSAVSEAEELYADAIGAKQVIFTTCGSTVSIHTSVLTVAGPGRKVLVDRNVHKSVVAALIMGGIEPVWLRPNWDHQREIAHPASPQAAAEALQADPDISAMIVITPTEYGTGADVHGFAELCHQYGIPLLVDEAWAAHFGFHPDPPTAAIQAGADLAVQSLHKAGAGLCQASMILLGGDLIDPVDLRLRLDMITTTSPSALMYGSIDGFRRRIVLHGKELIDAALERAERIRQRLQKIDAFEVIDDSIHRSEGVAEWDPLKLCVDVSALGITGYQAQEWLTSQRQLDAQLGDTRRVVCSLTYSDDDAAIDRLAEAFESLAADPPAPDRTPPAIPALEDLDLEQAMTPRDAFFADTEQLADPIGRISAEMISPYPPGVPAILPGERFTGPLVEYLRGGKQAGMTIPDAADPELNTFRVVR